MAIILEIVSHGRKVKAGRGRKLSDVLIEAGLGLSVYCRGRGLCGKCGVEILDGPRPEFKENEQRILERRGLGPAHRLACLYELQGSVRISIPETSVLDKVFILAQGIETPVEFDPVVKKYALDLGSGRPADESTWDRLERGLKLGRMRAELSLVRVLPAVLEQGGGRLTAVVYDDREILDLEPGDTAGRLFGLAVDLGTTTLVMDLVDLATGRVLDSEAALNSQAAYGADVVSRISLVFSEPDKADRVRLAAVKDLNRMAADLLQRNGLRSGDVLEMLVAGNTAMNHLLTGVSVSSLAHAPFNTRFSVLPPLPARELGLSLRDSGRVYIAPNIKSFVGGDIAAGLAASGFLDAPGPALYLDLGTNGEIALKTGDRVLVTSTAAGPAFEGMNISQGMLAVPGAVYKVEDEDGPRAFTIGDRPARGICGTGLIDFVAVCLKRGDIAPAGAILRPDKKLSVAPGVSLEQKDVRELQLAAAAVRSGIRMMLAAEGLRVSDLRTLFIAGAFGNYLNIARSMSLGLLPTLSQDKIVFLGNASLAGARLLLLSQGARRRLESRVAGIEHFSLAAQPGFQEAFIESLEFTPWGG